MEALGFPEMEMAEVRPETMLMTEHRDPKWCRGKGGVKMRLSLSRVLPGHPMHRVQGIASGV